MASTRNAASSMLRNALNPQKRATYNDKVKRILFEKQHMFIQTLLAATTYDDCDVATEASSTVCTEEEDDYDSDFYDSDSEEEGEEEDSDNEDYDDESQSSVEDGELESFERLASQQIARFGSLSVAAPAEAEVGPGDFSHQWRSDIAEEKTPPVRTSVRFDPNVVIVRPEQFVDDQSPLDAMDDRCPAVNLLEMVDGSTDTYVPSASVEGYFVKHSLEQIAAYDADFIGALRRNDFDEIRRMHQEEGHLMQASNPFGETAVHIASRRGALDIIRYMVEEGGVSIRVRDDYGRTPLHDCCWTAQPNVELMTYLVNMEPDMLFMTDSKGFTPLEYARAEHRSIWNKFLVEVCDVVTSRCRDGKLKFSN